MFADILIIGQGLAGTMLAHFLQQSGARVLILDAGHQNCASIEAAGLINPITGRRFVKSWRIDEFIPFARDTYRELEILYGNPLFYERPILRAAFSAREENDWWVRATDPGYEKYFSSDADAHAFQSVCKPVFSYGEISGGAQVEVAVLLNAFAEKGVREGWIRRERFEHKDLRLDSGKVVYRDIEAAQIVFCEGFGLSVNPFFPGLPIEGAKGEVLIARIPGFPRDKILKHKVFIAPMGGEEFWVGSTYEWGFSDATPTSAMRQFLTDRLDEILRVPYEVVNHRAAVRMTVKDRRPLIGRHPEYSQVFLFSGLGTKGASLSPYWGAHLAGVLLGRQPLDPEVDIRRFPHSIPD